METKNLTEKESLELIAGMINKTKKNLELGSGNVFLYYGYFTAALGLAIFLLVYFTGSRLWNFGWLLMFVFACIIGRLTRRKPNRVVTFTDEAVRHIWLAAGWLSALTAVLIFITGCIYGTAEFFYMIPLSLIYLSIAGLTTGLVLKEKWLTICPFVGVVVALFILLTRTLDPSVSLYWNLLYGLSAIPVMAIPGHILNYKAKKVC